MTNLSRRAETVIELYPQHGTSGQFHCELKSDLDVERHSRHRLVKRVFGLPPCAKEGFNRGCSIRWASPKRHIKELHERGRLKRVGSDKAGYWEAVEQAS